MFVIAKKILTKYFFVPYRFNLRVATRKIARKNDFRCQEAF